MKFDGLEPWHCENIKGIMAPEIGPKRFRTIEKQTLASKDQFGMPRWMRQQCNIKRVE